MSVTKFASNQHELERIAFDEQKQKILQQDLKLSDKNYFSATRFGQKLLHSTLMDPDTHEVKQVVPYLAGRIGLKILDQTNSNGNIKTTGYRLLVPCISTLTEAIEGDSNYAGKNVTAFDMLAIITLKAVVDPIGLKSAEEGQWPSFGAVIDRIALLIDKQRVDAFVSVHAPADEYKGQQRRWSRKNQGIGNQHTNIVLGQNQLLELTENPIQRWTQEERRFVGEWLLQIVVSDLPIVDRVDTAPVKGFPNGIACVRPKPYILEKYPEVLEKQCKNAIRGYPLIEAPIEWQHSDDVVGVYNSSGGYHSPAARDFNPMVRSRFKDNATTASQLGVDFLNTLGRTEFVVDEDCCAAFDWAYLGKQDIKSVPALPAITSEELQLQSTQRKAYIKEHNGVSPEGWVKGSDEHHSWREERAALYESVVDAEKKAARTKQMHQASQVIRDFDSIYFSWSFDYRGRAYPQQQLLQPQGSSVEKCFLRFAQGEPVTEASLKQIHIAIGAAFRDNNQSLAEREQWSRDNIDKVIASLEGEPSDIRIIEKDWDAAEPWDAYQLTKTYQRSVIGGELWDVPLAIDASSSGTQILSGLLRDEQGLLYTNVIVADPFAPDNGPVDGYVKVAEAAIRLIEAPDKAALKALTTTAWARKHALFDDPAVSAWLTRLLTHSKRRKLAKLISMPRVYGSKHQSGQKEIEKTLLAEEKDGGLNLDILAEIKATTNLESLEAWQLYKTVTSQLTSYLTMAVDITYPKPMASLNWLRRLATKALEKQTLNREKLHLEWQLHDGTVLDYWRMKQETRQVDMLELGRFKIPIGTSDKPDPKEIIKAFAPGFVHSLDGLLLRVALKDWDGPLVTVHDSIRVLPSKMEELKARLRAGLKEVCLENPIEALAEQMGVSMDELPRLEFGDADLDRIDTSRYMFH